MAKPNLLELTKGENGSTVARLAKSFGPLPPDDGDINGISALPSDK
jgi:hypothetical protein